MILAQLLVACLITVHLLATVRLLAANDITLVYLDIVS